MTYFRVPSATYRFQFNRSFTFKHARQLIPYLSELGVTDLYASPIMQARLGSMHGYDVCDPCHLNKEIGSEEEFRLLVKTLQQHKMGLILDIVPNHMSTDSTKNLWWRDLLENGPMSQYAHIFNVIWDPPNPKLKNKVLLPVLEEQFGKTIENQELTLMYEEEGFYISYRDHRFPLNPDTWPLILNLVADHLKDKRGKTDPDFIELIRIRDSFVHLPVVDGGGIEERKKRGAQQKELKKRFKDLLSLFPHMKQALQVILGELNGRRGDPCSFDRLEQLLNQQAYRLSSWRVTNDEINYRRFFDVNDLVSIRAEDEKVFAVTHTLILNYIAKGWVTGLRIDHVDGLYDPEEYFIRLQREIKNLAEEKDVKIDREFYLLTEKILTGHEKLPPQWLVSGTTGYDALILINGLFVSSDHCTSLSRIYHAFISSSREMPTVIYESKKLILNVSMSSELHHLTYQLEKISLQHRSSVDLTFQTLFSTLKEIISCFPVYRTYTATEDLLVRPEDRSYINMAVREAKLLNPAWDPSAFEFISSVLLLQDPQGLTDEEIKLRREFIIRFQQLTPPVTAKGKEDTALYRYYPLISLNEVGMECRCRGVEVNDFHKENIERVRAWPHTLIATSTHDTKRSEDVRARVNVLSENPARWNKALTHWSNLNRLRKIVTEELEIPGPNEEYLIYQTLIGTWPLYPMDEKALIRYRERIENYILKAIKEAKIHTSWINPCEQYESGVKKFIRRILSFEEGNTFIKEFEEFITPIIRIGLLNSLSQTLLKMTIPGVPDFYQGNELWEFQLVDPDNRVAVDYIHRLKLLNHLKRGLHEGAGEVVDELMKTPEDGRIKLYLIYKVLNYRKEQIVLFQQGEYIPLKVEGKKGGHVVAFSRRNASKQIIVAVGRFYSQLLEEAGKEEPCGNVWEDSFLVVPAELEGRYQDVLSGDVFTVEKNRLLVATLFSKIPLVMLERKD